MRSKPDPPPAFHGKLYHPTWTRLAAPVPGNEHPDDATPSSRNGVLFFQDCVDWTEEGTVVVTTSGVKDTRSNDYNERGVISSDGGVECVSIDGVEYGKVTLVEPLGYYHHVGEREYQCEVFLLTRKLVVRGNDYSEPTDTTPLGCDAGVAGYTDAPCPDTNITGFGGSYHCHREERGSYPWSRVLPDGDDQRRGAVSRSLSVFYYGE